MKAAQKENLPRDENPVPRASVSRRSNVARRHGPFTRYNSRGILITVRVVQLYKPNETTSYTDGGKRRASLVPEQCT